MSWSEGVAVEIGRVANWGSRFLAPAMPWIFLSLRRALIPTICWVILAAVFFVVPQSREVLHGLSEAPVSSIYDYTQDAAADVNFWALLSYVLTATLLSFAIWYCARLLCTVDAVNATPRVLGRGVGKTHLEQATTWLPRILGVSSLAAAVAALEYANLTPQLSQGMALTAVGASVIGPLAFSCVFLREATDRTWRWIALSLIGAIAAVCGGAVVIHQAEKWRVWTWCLTTAVLPTVMAIFLVKRRALLEWRGWDTTGMNVPTRSFGEVVVAVSVMLIAGVIALLALAFSGPFVVRGFGSAASVLLFLASAALFVTALQLVVRRLSRDVPGLTTASLLLVSVLVALIGSESLGTEQLNTKPASTIASPAVQASAAAAAQPADSGSAMSQGPASAKSPHVLVNAYGGGLRAAVFTAEFLAQADDATCGEFGESIAAVSGVSGGSLGLATYLVARQEFKARGGWKDCDKPTDTARTPLTDLVTRALVQDHLSTAIARMLAVDTPHFPGSPVRGQALLDSWQSALVRAFDPKSEADEPVALALPLGQLTGGTRRPVQAYFSATDADTGHIVWFSNQDQGVVFNNAKPGESAKAVPQLPVGQAVLQSARFPIVSPAGAFDFPGSNRMRLVDGGYADNSGTTTLKYAIEHSPIGAIPRESRVLIDIDGNPPDESRCISTSGRPPILTAVRGLLQARSAHAALAVEQIKSSLANPIVKAQLDLEAVFGVPAAGDARNSPQCEKVRRSQQAPLGWYVSYGAARMMAKSAEFAVADMLKQLQIPRRTMPEVVVADGARS